MVRPVAADRCGRDQPVLGIPVDRVLAPFEPIGMEVCRGIEPKIYTLAVPSVIVTVLGVVGDVNLGWVFPEKFEIYLVGSREPIKRQIPGLFRGEPIQRPLA